MVRKDPKEEPNTLKHKLNQKLSEVGATLQAQGQATTKAEENISDAEASSAVTKDTLLSVLKEGCKLWEKVTDLKSRSRRNNIRMCLKTLWETRWLSLWKTCWLQSSSYSMVCPKFNVVIELQHRSRDLMLLQGPSLKTSCSLMLEKPSYSWLGRRKFTYITSLFSSTIIMPISWWKSAEPTRERVRHSPPNPIYKVSHPLEHQSMDLWGCEGGRTGVKGWGFQVATAGEDPGSSMKKNILKAFPWQQVHEWRQKWGKKLKEFGRTPQH